MSHNNSYFKLIHFRDVTQWYVGYYLNDVGISSSYPLIPLRDIISPKRILIKKEDYDGETPIVEKIVFKTGQIVFREKRTTGMNLYALKQNDLLVSSINFHQGATALNTFGNVVASTHYQSYVINTELVMPEYLTMVLRSASFLSIVSGKKANGIKNESGYDFISAFKIPVPSLVAQKSIVKAYNDRILLASTLDNEIIRLDNSIDEYILTELGIKQTTRKSDDGAYSYSHNNQLNYMSFSRFKDLERWDSYNCRLIANSSFYPNVRLSMITKSKPQYGAGYSSRKYDGVVRYIRITDINDDGSLNDEKVSANGYSIKYLLKENDFLIARSGNTVGKTFLYKKEFGKSIYAGYLIKFELDVEKVLPEYLLYYTKSSVYKSWINSNMRVSAQPNINSQQYLDSPIVLPPIAIQRIIVDYIKKQKKKITQLKEHTKSLREEALQEFEKAIFE